jgi:hypothetical protein
MSTFNADASKGVHFKYFRRTADHLTFQIYKNGWRIPKGTEILVEFAFDRAVWGIGFGTGGESPSINAFGVVQVTFANDSVESFLREVRNSKKMRIHFLGGNEKDWIIDMNGSDKAVTELVKCAAKIGIPDSTQPYDTQHAPASGTQPFDQKDKAPVQPKRPSGEESF